MSKSKNKTIENDGNVLNFLSTIQNQTRKKDAYLMLDLMSKLTEQNPKMWGNSIIGFGKYHYHYDSGREGDFMKIGFSPRKSNLTIYIMPGFDQYNKCLANLGKFTTGKSCLYIKKLEDVDLKVLSDLIKTSYDFMTQKYG